MPRSFPFQALIGHEERGPNAITIVGLVVVCDILCGGTSRCEKRQYACRSWEVVDDSISSVEVCSAERLERPIDLSQGDLRYRNQIAEVTPACFERLLLASPSLYGRKASDVPLLIAFSKAVAEEVADGILPVVVLPAHAAAALRVPLPTARREEFDPLDEPECPGDVGDADLANEHRWRRYQWPLPLHIIRLASRLKNISDVTVVLRESACILSGPEAAFLQTENMSESLPTERTVLAWQIKLDWLTMISDRQELAATTDSVDRHVCADLSPQHGHHFMRAREEVFSTPQSERMCSVTGFAFRTWRLVPSVFGHGHCTAGDVVHRLLHSIILVAGLGLDKYRLQVRSWLSDQSKERKVPMSPARVIHFVAHAKEMTSVPFDSDELLFPNCWEILDHIHIIMNARLLMRMAACQSPFQGRRGGQKIAKKICEICISDIFLFCYVMFIICCRLGWIRTDCALLIAL